MAQKTIPSEQGSKAVLDYLSGDQTQAALATRFLLQVMAKRYPGRSVELRIPPFGAVQCIEGPRHTRGTPANVVETDPASWIHLALGKATFLELKQSGKLTASGSRADLGDLFPIFEV